ncbi:MAG TPA: hypothetical protein VFD83_00455 [Candidatus Polarisedimenticolia bacterium]|nr:hypothetical protein [Candidatus Polarisedimenticolia bacterium]
MLRAILRILVLSAILGSAASPALGAGPSTGSGSLAGPREGTRAPKHPKNADEYHGLGMDRGLGVFAGTVLDVNDHPVDNVIVDLFIDGELAGTTTTETMGTYQIQVPYDTRSDTTVLLWYVPQSGKLLPKELVIRESKASMANGLISRCIPRAELLPGRQFRVYLFDSTNRNKDLAELNCLPQ